MRYYPLGFLCVFLGLFSCNEKEKGDSPISFRLVLEDSIKVDHLGNLYLLDYDKKEQKYLLANESYYEYMEVNDQGEKLYAGSIPVDGPDAVDMVIGMGYYQSKVGIATGTSGFKIFDGGQIVDEISIPYGYSSFSFLPQLGLNSWNGGVLYPRFTADSLMNDGFTEDFYSKSYSLPLFEFQRPGEPLRNLISLPKDSPFLNGNYHGSLVLAYELLENDLYLINWIRPEVIKYQRIEDDFQVVKTVDLEIENWISYDPVPFANASDFYASFRLKMPGSVRTIQSLGELILVQYQAGISEEDFAKLLDKNGRPQSDLVSQLNPTLVAILDQDLNVISKGLRLPESVNGEFTINAQGQIVVSKNPNLSAIEDEGIILYKLRLVQE